MFPQRHREGLSLESSFPHHASVSERGQGSGTHSGDDSETERTTRLCALLDVGVRMRALAGMAPRLLLAHRETCAPTQALWAKARRWGRSQPASGPSSEALTAGPGHVGTCGPSGSVVGAGGQTRPKWTAGAMPSSRGRGLGT